MIQIRGKDRVSWLHGQVSTAIKPMKTLNHHHSSLNTPKGKTISLLHIIKLENEFLLLVPSALADTVFQSLNMYVLSEDVEILLSSKSVTAILDLQFTIKSPAEHIIEATYFGIPALLCISETAPDLDGLQELDKNSFEFLRIKNCYPMPGSEYANQEILTPELGMPSLIAYDKGCYLGQEVFARIRTYGRTNKVLAQMEFENTTPEQLLDQEISVGGHSRGKITSVVSHNLGCLALGYVPTAKKELGAEVICNQIQGKILS